MKQRRLSMNDHNLFYYPYAPFTNAHFPLLKVAALYFEKLVLLGPVGVTWDTIGAEHVARDAVRQLKDAGILEIVMPATVLAKCETPSPRSSAAAGPTASSWTCVIRRAGPPASSVGRSPRPKHPS